MGCWFMEIQIFGTGFVACCIIFVSAGVFNIVKKRSKGNVEINDVGNE